jgi:hypothetical protein
MVRAGLNATADPGASLFPQPVSTTPRRTTVVKNRFIIFSLGVRQKHDITAWQTVKPTSKSEKLDRVSTSHVQLCRTDNSLLL